MAISHTNHDIKSKDLSVFRSYSLDWLISVSKLISFQSNRDAGLLGNLIILCLRDILSIFFCLSLVRKLFVSVPIFRFRDLDRVVVNLDKLYEQIQRRESGPRKKGNER
jgi:hypothetical protein